MLLQGSINAWGRVYWPMCTSCVCTSVWKTCTGASGLCAGSRSSRLTTHQSVSSSLLSIGALMRRVFVLRTISMVFQSSLLTGLEPSPLMKGEAHPCAADWKPIWTFLLHSSGAALLLLAGKCVCSFSGETCSLTHGGSALGSLLGPLKQFHTYHTNAVFTQPKRGPDGADIDGQVLTPQESP